MRLRSATAAIVLAALAAAPAAADWLVLADGSRIETRGPWEVRGGLVVFTLPNGTLSSLRGTEVDLEASRSATEAALRPPEPPPPAAPKPKAKVVLTEADLPPVTRPAEEETAAADGEKPTAIGGSAPAGQDERVRIVDWNAATPDDFDGTVITGRLRNVGDHLLTQVMMEVNVYNAGGVLIGRTSAQIEPGPVAPDRVVGFEARFPNLFDVSAARFNARGVGFLEGEGAGRSAPATEGAGEGDGGPSAAAQAAAAETPPAP